MALFTGTATSFNSSNRVLHDGTTNLITSTVKCHLFVQANQPLVTNERLAELTPMSGGGYPGAVTLGGKSISNISGKNWRFNANNIDFVAGVGGIIDAYWWAFYEDDTVDKWLICFGQLDNTPGAVSAAQGDSILIQPNATNGFYRLDTTT